nr:winged helix-turn-helix transcriptional regulator [Bacteroidota bacterium]
MFQDTIHGHLFEQVERAMALLLSKYLKATITYKGLNRMEKYPKPVAALREAVLNAIVHKDYASQIPVQISVYADKLIIWNEGQFPDDWTIENLKSKHPSRPYNPAIANVFFRAGLIEAWGRGTINILNECKLAKISQPIFKYEFSGFIVEFRYNFQSILQKGKNAEADKTIDKVLIVISHNETITISELAKKIGVAQITIKRAISELRQLNKLQREGSSKTGKWKVI